MEQEKIPISPNIQTDSLSSLAPVSKSNGIGKFKVIYRSNNRLISLGPDYYFFLPAFSMFLLAAIYLFKLGQSCSQNPVFKILTCSVAIIQPLSYIWCALSNPGIVTESVVALGQINTTNKSNIRFCKDCNIYVNSTTRHCQDCQLCIDGYDHHCPWVSKCIGKCNLKMFYLFVIMTPIFMVYLMVTIAVCFADFQEYPHAAKHSNRHG